MSSEDLRLFMSLVCAKRRKSSSTVTEAMALGEDLFKKFPEFVVQVASNDTLGAVSAVETKILLPSANKKKA